MAQPLYRMARAEALSIVHLDSFIAVFHRGSGLTHLITAPAPEIMATLGEAGLTRDGLSERLAVDFELADLYCELLSLRLEELVACVLVSAA